MPDSKKFMGDGKIIEVPHGAVAAQTRIAVTPLDTENPFSATPMEATVAGGLMIGGVTMKTMRPEDLPEEGDDSRIGIHVYVHGVRTVRELILSKLLCQEMETAIEEDAPTATAMAVLFRALDMLVEKHPGAMQDIKSATEIMGLVAGMRAAGTPSSEQRASPKYPN